MLRLVYSIVACFLLLWPIQAMRADHLAQLRQETVDMFYHGYNNYMQHAFPEDELRPVTCAPLTRDRNNPADIGLNDPLGNYSLTLIDSLSTLAILAGAPEDDKSPTGPQALSDFQHGIEDFVTFYGDGRQGSSGQGIRAFGFDLDSKVQVFETVIRGVGGLLSAHLFAVGELPINGYRPSMVGMESDDPLELSPILWPGGFEYDGQLLRLALDLGQRLLPAFYTPTGIPYPRVNLRHGIPFYVNSPLHEGTGKTKDNDVRREITETCSAGAGSLTLEFTVLSRLTGDPRFEQAAKRAFWEVWERRSEIDLIGNGLDAERGVWIGTHSGIGAGMDSFFEYALKSHILLSGHDVPANMTVPRNHRGGDLLDPETMHAPLPTALQSSDAFLETWHVVHDAVKQYIYTDRGEYPYYANNHRPTGQPYTLWIDSLAAFYPGLLALAGETEEAIEANLLYTALWTRFSALPERWSLRDNNVDSGLGWWPGRPEFIESTYYIYRATQDPWYLHVGEMVLRDIKRRCRTSCGWAGLQDVRTGEKMDRMESFFLGETTKYMYLLFDPDHALNKLDAPFVFTTEGHPLIIPKKRNYGSSRNIKQPSENRPRNSVQLYSYFDETLTHSCPAYPAAPPLSGSATAARANLFDVARFTGLHWTPNVNGPFDIIEHNDDNLGRIKWRRPTTNHTIFPWTLPRTLLPDNGTCAAPPDRVKTWIEFPSDTLDNILTRYTNALTWLDYRGPTVRQLAGLRLQLEKEQTPEGGGPVWRIIQAALTLLGRHETVSFYAEHVKHMKDEAFTAVRRQDAVEIHMIVSVEPTEYDIHNASMPLAGDLGGSFIGSSSSSNTPALLPTESLFKNLLRAVTSVFDPDQTPLPTPEPSGPKALIHTRDAYTPVGPGAFPMPSISDTPLPGGPGYITGNPLPSFPWKTIYLAGYACDGPLPEESSRQHHVIVLKRGHCSFSTKIGNIPAFSAPSPAALKMVVVIDEAEGEGELEPMRPLLDKEQFTPRGSKRLNGIPMVLLSGGRGDYELLGKASGVGMRRKYIVMSQGLLIKNAVVL